MRVADVWRGALWTAAGASPFVLHMALGAESLSPAAALLAAYQVALIGLVLFRRSRPGRIAWLLLVVPAFLLASRFLGHVSVLAASGLSHTLIYSGLFAFFARTLRPGRIDLCTAMAARLRGALTPEMSTYTRNVTIAWCVFFAGQLAASLALALFASAQVWSLFVNVLEWPLVAAMFLAELAIRRWRFKSYDHVGIAETIRAFVRQQSARAGS